MTLWRLSLLGAFILNDRCCVGELRVIADGAEHSFSGKTLTQAYHEALQAAREACKLEIIWNYSYSWSLSRPDPAHFSMLEHLDEVLENSPDGLEGFFYSAYSNADAGSGAGISVAYGKKNGVMYSGELPFAAAESIPAGDWYTPDTAVVCDIDVTAETGIARLEAVCREMGRFSQADSLVVSDDSFSFALNNLRIRDDGELKEFMALYARLLELSDGEAGLIGELADVSCPDVKILHFDVEADGAYSMELASV